MISCDGICYIVWAFLLLAVPLEWLLSVVSAALFHELSHILAVVLLKGKIRRVHVGIAGCEIETQPMGDLASCLSILAGPLGSFLLLLFRKQCPLMAVCGFLQGVYNLLPVMPLDGGRILRCLLCRFCPEKVELVMRVAKILVLTTATIAILRLSLAH